MPQWQYRAIDLNEVPLKTDDIDVLNGAGDDGWELVAITSNNVAYLKRPHDDPEPLPGSAPNPAKTCGPARGPVHRVRADPTLALVSPDTHVCCR